MFKKIVSIIVLATCLISLVACGAGGECTEHDFEGGVCKKCGYECTHDFESSDSASDRHVCKICKMQGRHKYVGGICTICGYYHIDHEYNENSFTCKICQHDCVHEVDENGVCKHCGCSYTGEFDLINVQALPTNELTGLTVFHLGSSVSYGARGNGFSFADYIATRNDQTIVKETVSGTTLCNNDYTSYVKRIEHFDKNASPDLFICQLSTNDATNKLPLGEIIDSTSIMDFNTKTVCGAIEYIIAYVRQTWDCPVVFYSGTYYDSVEYGLMVENLLEIQEKWDIGVIDMWNSDEMKAVSEEDYGRYMNDSIHPTREGYLKWWTPFMEEYLILFISKVK